MGDFYGAQQRALQDEFGTRLAADLLDATVVRHVLTPKDATLIESCSFFFLSTVDSSGPPTVSHKGGRPGFVRVLDESTIAFPSFDGNGMYLSLGNIAGHGLIGLLFIDFDARRRVRVHASATLVRDDPLLRDHPDADVLVRATVIDVFPNCGRRVGRD
jgi:predicted pyridoxine 5'-phosphate oxidase superfamily flavin-nucleotide-binding protein